MKKLFIIPTLVFVGIVALNAQIVQLSQQHHSQNHTGSPLCRNYNVTNHPKYCKSPLFGSYPCDLCPVCDENNELVICGENDLPANGRCCLDTRIDLHRLQQLPAKCKIDEGQAHPCGQCPVYYEKPKDTCLKCTGESGMVFPCCFEFNGQGGDGVCPTPDKSNGPSKPAKILTPVKPKSEVKNPKNTPSKNNASKSIAGNK